ncbi:MAG: ABC transporter permease, partial [Brachybacterium tyrofermentans]
MTVKTLDSAPDPTAVGAVPAATPGTAHGAAPEVIPPSGSLQPSPARWRALARRAAAQLGSAILLLWAVATIVFFLQHMVPGDPALAILGGASANPPQETVQAVREQYGFDQPILVQYVAFLGGLLHLDIGESYTMKESVLAVIGEQIVPTHHRTPTAQQIAG